MCQQYLSKHQPSHVWEQQSGLCDLMKCDKLFPYKQQSVLTNTSVIDMTVRSLNTLKKILLGSKGISVEKQIINISESTPFYAFYALQIVP